MTNGDPEPKDAWMNVVMRGKFILTDTENGDFGHLDPLLAKERTQIVTQTVSEVKDGQLTCLLVSKIMCSQHKLIGIHKLYNR